MPNEWEYSTYSKINPEVEQYFPFEKPRQHQLETISEIKEAIDKGYKYIVLEAGTGTGKSAIAATLTSMFSSSYIFTVTKQLQDQYIEDFKDDYHNLKVKIEEVKNKISKNENILNGFENDFNNLKTNHTQLIENNKQFDDSSNQDDIYDKLIKYNELLKMGIIPKKSLMN